VCIDRKALKACLLASVSLLPFALACSSDRTTGRSSSVVSVSGRIGPLQIGRSDARAVIAFAGRRPDAERRGRQFGSALYRAFGYSCSDAASDVGYPLLKGGPYCRTIFFINARTRRLGTFFTSSSRYSEAHGVRIGMKTAVAERLLHKRVYAGCEDDLYFRSRTAALTIAFTGGVTHKIPGSSGLHLVGGHVYAFVLHSPRSDVGVFDCL
jgi:hypothetical protein